MYDYKKIEQGSEHRLVNGGQLQLVATYDGDEGFDIAPIAWNCPVKKEPPRFLTAIGKSHKTHENIVKTGLFVMCTPHLSQIKLVRPEATIIGIGGEGSEEDLLAVGVSRVLPKPWRMMDLLEVMTDV